MVKHTAEKKDAIEIPVGKYLENIRKNPWIVSTVILAIVLIVVIALKWGSSDASVISGGEAGQKLISFINSNSQLQGKGNAELVSSEKDGALYKVTVAYNGQNIPVYVTLDGKYLIAQPIPLSSNPQLNSNSNTANQNNANNARVNVTLGDSPRKGNPKANVTIVEFIDYQCPFCKKFFVETYPQIVKDYVDTGKVLFVIKDFPLTSIHSEAEKAAEAARCVKDQKGDSGYFKMHDKLFGNQENLSVENEKKWARELGLSGAIFDSCLDSGKFAKAVKDDKTYGQSLGITGTPGFFINGQLIEEAVPYSAFKQAIDAELGAN